GLIRGDGHLATYCYVRQGGAPGNQYQFRLALIDEEPLKRASGYLAEFGIGTRSFTFQEAAPGFSRLEAIRTHARGNVERVGEVIAWPFSPTPSWWKGYLAGIFDAEGSYSEGVLRIPNTDPTIIHHTTRGLEQFGFDFAVERREEEGKKPQEIVRLRGGLKEH